MTKIGSTTPTSGSPDRVAGAFAKLPAIVGLLVRG